MTVRTVFAGLLLLWPCASAAQDFRGELRSNGRYIEVRPIRLDTVARDLVSPGVGGRLEFEGQPVFCNASTGTCTRYVSAPVEHAVLLTQDVAFTAWGFGVTGLSATVLLRGRADAGGGFDWPRADDPFDAILAYAELNRERWRVRVGRQQTAGGLGFSSYDGASALYDATDWLRIDAYAGRSLARALYEPRNEALRGVEAFLPDEGAVIVGGAVEADVGATTTVAGRYQREIWWDRSALVSERASVDARTSHFAPVRLAAAFDYDFAFGRIGKAHITAALPVPGRALAVEAIVRRYVPYFELWTIWGYFSPVGYHEAEVAADWQARPGLSVRGTAAWRDYEDTETVVVLDPLEDSSLRVEVAARWTRDSWSLDASYAQERGFGATMSAADAAISRALSPRATLTASGSAFQQIEEFRIGDGFVIGGGLSADVEVLDRTHVNGGVTLYRQTFDNRPGGADWNQMRAWLGLRFGFGRDAGLGSGS